MVARVSRQKDSNGQRDNMGHQMESSFSLSIFLEAPGSSSSFLPSLTPSVL